MKTYKKVLSLLLLVLVVGLLVSCGTDYTVNFDANNNTEIVKVKVASGSKVSKPADPTKTGYEFEGWFLEDEEFDFDKAIDKDITLVGHWTIKELTVIFDTNGGTQIADEKVAYGEVVAKPENPTRANSIFVGWYIGDNLYDFDEEVTDNITITAKWEDGYKVIYHLNFDDKTIELDATPGELLEGIEIEQREGFTFAGWFKNNSFTRPWNMLTDLMPNESLNLYAKWDPVPVITGIADFTYKIGDELPDLMLNVAATDALDGDLQVSLSVGDLDFTEEGTYEIAYSAENLSGIKTTEIITVTVIYENRLVISNEETPQKVYIQIEEEILGFYIELSFTETIEEKDITLLINDWISDIYVSDGLIKISATGLNSLDAYLLTEILTVNSNISLTIEKIIVDTVTENGVIIK